VAIVEWDSLDDAVALYKSKATPSVKHRDHLKVNGALVVGSFAACCARAASGHAAAPPRSVAKNFRRPM
jgi:hypothetical protein